MKTISNRSILLLIAILALAVDVEAQFFDAASAPQATWFVDQPIEEESPMWAADTYSHFRAKRLRDPAIEADVKDANYDAKPVYDATVKMYFYSYHLKFFQPALGLTVNNSVNKHLFNFLDSCRLSTRTVVNTVPDSWTRTRPFVRFREASFGTARTSASYANNYYTNAPPASFPSPECATGWMAGLTLSAITPWRCDTLLTRAYQHGLYRQVSGGMWRRDVEASRMIGTVTFARMLALQPFKTRLRQLRSNVSQLLSIDNAAPSIEEILANRSSAAHVARLMPGPVLPTDGDFQADLAHYLASLNVEWDYSLPAEFYYCADPIEAFSVLLNNDISELHTPYLYRLFMNLAECCSQIIDSMPSANIDLCPIDVFYVDQSVPGYYFAERLPYKQIQASVAAAWSMALLLTALSPDSQETLIKAGIGYGDHYEATGVSWHSNIVAARQVGCVAFGMVASGGDFLDLLEKAKEEVYLMLDYIVTDMPEIVSDPTNSNQPIFTIDGRPAQRDSHGLLISPERKIIVP